MNKNERLMLGKLLRLERKLVDRISKIEHALDDAQVTPGFADGLAKSNPAMPVLKAKLEIVRDVMAAMVGDFSYIDKTIENGG